MASPKDILSSPDKQASPSLPELIPPQPNPVRTNTVVAGNPFDDQPPSLTPLVGTMQQTMPPNKAPHQSPTAHPNAGKVYPPNQPMVFNASNPNAPPINPCGTCHKEVHENDQAIFCESGCNFWFHRMCTGLTEMAYTMLTAEVYAEWVCDKCLLSKNIPLVKMKP
ncbi:protein pygopus-like isoform X2 [Liolophura sinensis]|uniref:protein pygopus-like isoform X2 n=1 Tax=Liolophura sinensis TaxID=3198878 RepID=UPI00315846A4